MIQSMTAFASRTGGQDGVTWDWDVRSVNARGLDLRLRLPDGFERLEPSLRTRLADRFKRGAIAVTLRQQTDQRSDASLIDPDQLDRVLAALDQVQNRAFELGVTLAQPTAADVLNHRGLSTQATRTAPSDAILDAAAADFDHVLDDLAAMRRHEGAALATIIAGQIDTIAALLDAASAAVVARKPAADAALRAAIDRVQQDIDIDPDRLAQELALLAVKTDVTEELDRLGAHVTAARDLLAASRKSGDPVGRRLDFLSQEFNREANTLCAKAQYPALTAIGLDLKTVIDQMREQIQNVE